MQLYEVITTLEIWGLSDGYKANAKYGWHLSNLVAFFRLNIFVKIELQKWMNRPFKVHDKPIEKNSKEVLFPDYQ